MRVLSNIVEFVNYNLTGIFLYTSFFLFILNYILPTIGFSFFGFILFLCSITNVIFNDVRHSWKEYKNRHNNE